MKIENLKNKVPENTGIVEFVETQVNIDFINDVSYGHYPFQLRCTSEDNTKNVMAALALNRIEMVLDEVNQYNQKGYDEILFSMDFPRGGDMESDFLLIVSIKENILKVIAIEYNPETGDVTRLVNEEDSEFLADFITNIRKRLSL